MATWLTVWNETEGQPALGRVRRCAGFLCRLRGLTFRRRLGDDEGLLLVGNHESRANTAIHMFFVFFPITAVWLDRNGQIVDARLARPFRPFYAPRAPARDVLEGPPELLGRVRIGDRLLFREDGVEPVERESETESASKGCLGHPHNHSTDWSIVPTSTRPIE